MIIFPSMNDMILVILDLQFLDRGVFSKQNVSSNELPKVMCLYPGIYTPVIPLHAMGNAEYLANNLAPSFEGDISENAYILNLACGGYIDGLALNSQYVKHATLDCNPSACGHLVNHDAIRNNVEVHSFSWEELTDGQDTTTSASNTTKGNNNFPLPNELRADGSPWYFDTSLDKMVAFPRHDEDPLPQSTLCGAALVLTKPVFEGDELLIDYGLKEPYPKWAKDWYHGTI